MSKLYVTDELIHRGKRLVRGDEFPAKDVDEDVIDRLKEDGALASARPSPLQELPSGDLGDVPTHVLKAELEAREATGDGDDEEFDPASVPEDADEKALKRLKVDQLKAVAADREVDVAEDATKADLVKALKP